MASEALLSQALGGMRYEPTPPAPATPADDEGTSDNQPPTT